MAEKQNNKERLKDITDSIETGIKELFESDKYKNYLQTMSRFHNLQSDETELKELATSVIAKLQAMSADGFTAVANELIADFEQAKVCLFS